jgi:hypothetical protein
MSHVRSFVREAPHIAQLKLMSGVIRSFLATCDALRKSNFIGRMGLLIPMTKSLRALSEGCGAPPRPWIAPETGAFEHD